MKTSEELNEISTALAKFQGSVGSINQNKQVKIQTKKGDWIIFKYADLAGIMNTIRKPLAENGLSVSQTYSPGENGKSVMVTTVYHSSGQYISSSFSMPPWADIKTLGGNMTYLRRYCLSSILALVTDEDIDATELKVEEEPKKGEKEATDAETTIFLKKWESLYTSVTIGKFFDFKHSHIGMTKRQAVTAFSKKPDAFLSEIDAWLAKKEKEGQSEGD